MNKRNFVALACLMALCLQNARASDECPAFTTEQEILLHKAYVIGNKVDLGYTLASIVWKESIVGDYVVRVNGPDGNLGSYGVAHMQLTTAMWLLGEDNRWRAAAELAPRMINNDVFALKLARDYLHSHSGLGWRGMITRYNGQGYDAKLYSEDVVSRVKILQQCFDIGD